eukprot:4830558-Pyramimonas_sp.AAC.1
MARRPAASRQHTGRPQHRQRGSGAQVGGRGGQDGKPTGKPEWLGAQMTAGRAEVKATGAAARG